MNKFYWFLFILCKDLSNKFKNLSEFYYDLIIWEKDKGIKSE